MRNLGLDQRLEGPLDATAIRPGIPGLSAGAGLVPKPSAPAVPERRVAVLGPTLRFKGELSADEDFILQGRLEGSIHHTQSVTIGTDGVVQGNIHARSVTIDGTVEGDLHGSESVVVHATGRVTGNIFAPRVGVIEGALFNGRIEMVKPAVAARPPASRSEAPGVVLSAEETARVLGNKA
jgi:cytoskeletal protein CcmA (bactofilin family)